MRAEHHLRVVIDTNVWSSAALSPGGAPASVVRHVLAHGAPVFSQATFNELQTRLWKPKFDRWLSIEQRQRLLHDLNACALWAEVSAEVATRTYSRDPDDDAFIHAAWAGGALWLVSGDNDLLAITEALPFSIVAPAGALQEPRFMAQHA